MTESLQTTAQYTLFRALDVTAVATFQRSVTAAPQPSFTDIFIRACALALREHPVVNARIEGDRLIERTAIDIGFAVAIEEGVLAPIVRAADTLSLAEISIRTRELAQQCRERRITTADLEGAGFGITSLGGQGIDAFTPILNPPEAGILGIGRTREQAVRYGEGLGWRTELIASLTLDHRVVDGAQGAAFLATIADLLADPRRLLG
jgi:pyruvate dehydrogenase E2 component (dihydrolipoamide acetyltransferase)